jgi:hypothetical protein
MFALQLTENRTRAPLSNPPSLGESVELLERAIVRLEIAALAQRARLGRAERRYRVLEHHGDATVEALDVLIAAATSKE